MLLRHGAPFCADCNLSVDLTALNILLKFVIEQAPLPHRNGAEFLKATIADTECIAMMDLKEGKLIIGKKWVEITNDGLSARQRISFWMYTILHELQHFLKAHGAGSDQENQLMRRAVTRADYEIEARKETDGILGFMRQWKTSKGIVFKAAYLDYFKSCEILDIQNHQGRRLCYVIGCWNPAVTRCSSPFCKRHLCIEHSAPDKHKCGGLKLLMEVICELLCLAERNAIRTSHVPLGKVLTTKTWINLQLYLLEASEVRLGLDDWTISNSLPRSKAVDLALRKLVDEGLIVCRRRLDKAFYVLSERYYDSLPLLKIEDWYKYRQVVEEKAKQNVKIPTRNLLLRVEAKASPNAHSFLMPYISDCAHSLHRNSLD